MAGANKGYRKKRGPSRKPGKKVQLTDAEKAERAAEVRRVMARRR